MSLAMGFFGGLGKGAADIADQNTKFWNEQDLEKQKSAEALAREQSILRLKQSMAEAPLLRLQDKAKTLVGQEVPVEPAPVDKLTGAGVSLPDGQPLIGLQGDPAALKAQVNAMPDGPDKTAILAQIDTQMSADKATNAAAVAGKTRPRTQQEALDAAADWAKTNDLPALAAYETAIGKPAREDRRVAVAEKRADTADTREAAREKEAALRQATYDKKVDNDTAYQQRREERLDKMADLQEQRLKSQGDKQETQSQRASVVELMKSSERELERTLTLAKDPMLDDATKKMFESRVANLTKDVGRYRKSLESFGGDGIVPAEPDKPPAPTEAAILKLQKNPDKKADFDKLFGPGAADAALAKSATPAAATVKPAAPSEPQRALVGEKADPIAIQFQAETREMNDMKRTVYSPEVQAYIDKRKADKESADQAASADYKERERRRALNNPFVR